MNHYYCSKDLSSSCYKNLSVTKGIGFSLSLTSSPTAMHSGYWGVEGPRLLILNMTLFLSFIAPLLNPLMLMLLEDDSKMG